MISIFIHCLNEALEEIARKIRQDAKDEWLFKKWLEFHNATF